MVYTRWKCDRWLAFVPKFYVQDYAFFLGANCACATVVWKYFSWCSEETERKNAWWSGYPWWRDPIQKRKEIKYAQMIRDNDVDITAPKWTGVRAVL